jgi:2-polyprenyl-6-methoxyphenol hydroxylase-like FAD-dependent oxidoreductase
MSLVTIPGDNDTWGWSLVTAANDKELRALRSPAVRDRVLALFPGTAESRAAGIALTDVQVLSCLEDRQRRLVVDDVPVVTGLVAVGDAWACTNPTLGRGATIGLLHVAALRDVLRAVRTSDPEKLVRCFAEDAPAMPGVREKPEAPGPGLPRNTAEGPRRADVLAAVRESGGCEAPDISGGAPPL